MCGRFKLSTPGEELAEAFGLDSVPDVEPRYNIAPSQPLLIVRREGAVRRATQAFWGMRPPWAGPPGEHIATTRPKTTPLLINARLERAASTPAFRDAIRMHRCLVPADGFYEWKKIGQVRQPFLFRMRDRRPFALAGLFQAWEPPQENCAIVTCAPNPLVATVHDRMPLILPAGSFERWLDPDVGTPAQLAAFGVAYPAEAMEAVPVSMRVNRADIDDAECAREIAAAWQDPQKSLW